MQLIENIHGKKNGIKVLRHLIKHKGWQFNITELAKDASINKGALSRLVQDFEKENIIKVSRKGKIKLFCINKENIFIREVIIPLFEKENSFFFHILREAFKKIKKEAESIIVYGSAASGKIKLTSDIDILVIVNKKNKVLEKKLDTMKENFLEGDFLLRIDLISVNELTNLHKTNEPFFKSLAKNHKVLFGKSVKELIK